MSDVARREQTVAWQLRDAWMDRSKIRLTLTERCILRTIVGQVSKVSVTGAFAVVDGWHVPCVEVLGTGKPTIEDFDRYTEERDRVLASLDNDEHPE